MGAAVAPPPPSAAGGWFPGGRPWGRQGWRGPRPPPRLIPEMSEPIKVAVAGHRGKVGSVLVSAFQSDPGIDYVGGISRGDDLAAFLHEKRPRAFVDFTRPSDAMHNVLAAVAAGASPVVGTSGLSPADVDKLETACNAKAVGGIVAPNFAIGAVVMM